MIAPLSGGASPFAAADVHLSAPADRF